MLENEYRGNSILTKNNFKNPDEMLQDGEITDQVLSDIQSRASSLIIEYRSFIENASKKSDDAGSKILAAKIIETLDAEISWYAAKKTETPSRNSIFTYSNVNTIGEIIRDYPLLKKTLIGMLSIYLTIRYLPVYYPLIRDTRK